MLDSQWVYFQIEPSQMTMFIRLLEGLDHVGVVTTLDGKQGIAYVRTTADTKSIVCRFLSDFPFSVTLLSFEEMQAFV